MPFKRLMHIGELPRQNTGNNQTPGLCQPSPNLLHRGDQEIAGQVRANHVEATGHLCGHPRQILPRQLDGFMYPVFFSVLAGGPHRHGIKIERLHALIPDLGGDDGEDS